jgi:hypothetical protein
MPHLFKPIRQNKLKFCKSCCPRLRKNRQIRCPCPVIPADETGHLAKVVKNPASKLPSSKPLVKANEGTRGRRYKTTASPSTSHGALAAGELPVHFAARRELRPRASRHRCASIVQDQFVARLAAARAWLCGSARRYKKAAARMWQQTVSKMAEVIVQPISPIDLLVLKAVKRKADRDRMNLFAIVLTILPWSAA